MSSTEFQRPAHWTNDRQFFFKYVTRATGRIVLERRTLRWSKPGTLNDPYDMQFDPHIIDVDREAVKESALQKSWDAHYGDSPVPAGNPLGVLIQSLRGVFPNLSREEFDREFGESIEEGFAAIERTLPWVQERVRQLMADSKILCLTESPDSKVMWTHYAEGHQGVVLKFKSIPELDSAWGAARAVQYVADMPRLLDEDFLSDMFSGRVSMNPQSIIDRLVYTKSANWVYEREWRIFAGAGRDPTSAFEDLRFHPLELDAVIIGCRMPNEDRSAFAELTQRLYPHAQLLQAQLSEKEFKIIIKPLEL